LYLLEPDAFVVVVVVLCCGTRRRVRFDMSRGMVAAEWRWCGDVADSGCRRYQGPERRFRRSGLGLHATRVEPRCVYYNLYV
jgi:hypothetical protein